MPVIDDPWLVDVYETKVLKVDVMAEDGPFLNLEKFENEKKNVTGPSTQLSQGMIYSHSVLMTHLSKR